MSTLDTIRDELGKVERPDRLYYGVAAKLPKDAPWDYTVFSRDGVAPKASLTGFTHLYIVAVVREGYVPEGLDLEIIEAMEKIPGMKLNRAASIEYLYTVKPGTQDTVEEMVLHFAKAVKS